MSRSIRRRFSLTIGRKIYSLIGLTLVGLLAIVMVDSRELASSLKLQKQIELQHLIQIVSGSVKEERAAAEKAGIPTAEARKRTLARIAALGYGKDDYFFIADM
jgi:methyl-accepting chemotaxis protein